MSLTPEMSAKREALAQLLAAVESLMIAYSGGTDSAFLAWAAHQTLGDRMLAVIADSPSLARFQLADAIAFANEHAIPVEAVRTSEFERPEYVRNDGARCFHCKDELFLVMDRIAQERGFSAIAYGVNLDDKSDFRPGQAAATRHGILAPFVDAQLTKNEIRQLAQAAGLRIWDKPASACLSSRIEYGRPVTTEGLSAIERGEDWLRSAGFRQFRVRHHGDIVRIEIAAEEMSRALDLNM